MMVETSSSSLIGIWYKFRWWWLLVRIMVVTGSSSLIRDKVANSDRMVTGENDGGNRW